MIIPLAAALFAAALKKRPKAWGSPCGDTAANRQTAAAAMEYGS
jgi:hypothetical protein